MSTREHFVHETDAEYHTRRRDCVTFHSLKEFARSPRYFKRMRDGLVPDTDTSTFAFGRAAHVFILEGEESFAEQYAVGGPINPKTDKPYGTETKAFAEWAAEKGKPVISVDQLVTIQEMAAAVERNPRAVEILAADDAIVEGVLRREYASTGNTIMDRLIPWQSRIDYYSPTHGVVDLKTTRDMDEFLDDARKYGYDRQMAFYREAVRGAIAGNMVRVPCTLIAVENREPFRCVVVDVTEDVLMAAKHWLDDVSNEFENCRKTDGWPDNLVGGQAVWTNQ